jgi:hypothetical protein
VPEVRHSTAMPARTAARPTHRRTWSSPIRR